MNSREKREQWEARMSDFKRSGLTQLEWCKQNDCKLSGFRYWKNKLYRENAESEQPEWLSVNVKGNLAEVEPIHSSKAFATVRIGAFAVEIPQDCNPSTLAILFKTLAGLC